MCIHIGCVLNDWRIHFIVLFTTPVMTLRWKSLVSLVEIARSSKVLTIINGCGGRDFITTLFLTPVVFVLRMVTQMDFGSLCFRQYWLSATLLRLSVLFYFLTIASKPIWNTKNRAMQVEKRGFAFKRRQLVLRVRVVVYAFYAFHSMNERHEIRSEGNQVFVMCLANRKIILANRVLFDTSRI